MPKSNVTVSRYMDKQLGWEACVRPEDGSWCLFIPRPDEAAQGLPPQLWLRVGTCKDEHGDTHDSYALSGSPEHLAFISNFDGLGLCEPFDEEKIAADAARIAEYQAKEKQG